MREVYFSEQAVLRIAYWGVVGDSGVNMQITWGLRRQDRIKMKDLRRGGRGAASVGLAMVSWISIGLLASVCFMMAKGRHTAFAKGMAFLPVAMVVVFTGLLTWSTLRRMVFSLGADEGGAALRYGMKGREGTVNRRSWAELQQWKEDAEHFAVFSHDKLFALVPKRAMTAPQVEEFRMLLKKKLKEQPV